MTGGQIQISVTDTNQHTSIVGDSEPRLKEATAAKLEMQNFSEILMSGSLGLRYKVQRVAFC